MVSKWMIGVRPDLRVEATDCGVYPIDLGELGTIRFHGQTWLEALPFADGVFGAVVSQFAFEYADRAQALRECGRVLGNQGLLSFVIG
jgi:SAM-dependent methyltransferase